MQNIIGNKIYLLVLFCLLKVHVSAQQLYLKQFTVDQGLPSNEVYQVIQDNEGNIIAATDRGAVRYDGYSFKNILFENGEVTNPVYYIYKSPSRKIFFSGLKGNLYQYKNDVLHNYAYNKKISSVFRHSGLLIANTVSEKSDSLWVSYNNDFSYNFKIGSSLVLPNGEVSTWEKPDGIYFDIPRKFYYRQLNDSIINSKQPVFITWENGSETIDSIELNWRSGFIRRLYYEKVAGFDIFCIGRKIHIYKNGKKVNSHLFDHHILAISIIDNQLFLGFENGGAKTFNINNGSIHGPVHTYLDNLTVTSIYKDHQGGTWFATMESGLFYSYPSAAQIWKSDNKVAFIEKNRDKIFVGYTSGLIDIYKHNILEQSVQLPIDETNSLLRLAFNYDDSLIAITFKGYFLKKTNHWQFFPGSDIQVLSVNQNLAYGAAAAYAELRTYTSLGGKMINSTPLPKRILSMLYDNNNQLWLGTWEGLFKFHNNKLINLNNTNDVFNDRIIGIKQLDSNWLVIASLGSGLIITNNKTYYKLNSGNGLNTPVINSLVVNNNDIWLGTNKGLSKVNFDNGKFNVKHFGTESGLPTINIHQFTINNGFAYLKWNNNTVLLSLNKLESSLPPLNTSINQIIVNGKNYENTNPSLDYVQNDLTFNFNAVNISAAPAQSFNYKLEGFDNKWYNTKERYIKYTNLPPGSYTFKVQAVSDLSANPASIATSAFIINPALWQRWWFILIISGITILILYALFRIRLHSIKAKNSLLLNLAESQQKALVQLINPHFIFNLLNTVQGAILKEERLHAASIVSRFAKLLRMSMEMSKEKMVPLEKETDLLKKYFELEAIRAPEKFSFEISVAPEMNPSSIYIPAMLIQPFVENSIKHGIMHLADLRGSIKITFLYHGESLYCVVDDNGVGRNQSKNINKNIRQNHESSGINITIERLKLLHQQRGTSFYYQVQDKISDNGHAQGTKIVFSLPFSTSYVPN